MSSLNLSAENLSNKEYTVGPEDVLDIRVWDNEDLNRTVEVSQEGAFTFPLIGKVHADGLSLYELENLIKKMLADGYIIAPQVTVSIKEYQSQKVFIIGEVNKPGSYILKRKTLTVRQAISLAGGPTQMAALKRTRIIRVKNGKEEEYKVHMDDLVMPDDIIKVPGRYF